MICISILHKSEKISHIWLIKIKIKVADKFCLNVIRFFSCNFIIESIVKNPYVNKSKLKDIGVLIIWEHIISLLIPNLLRKDIQSSDSIFLEIIFFL